MTFAEMHVKWSLILADRLGPEILIMLEIKGQVLHLVRVHLKVPGWLSDLKALLTRKLPMFAFVAYVCLCCPPIASSSAHI